eukprot:scaffold533_cov369-Prasinococcus_capsulatus_cf.AAC.15
MSKTKTQTFTFTSCRHRANTQRGEALQYYLMGAAAAAAAGVSQQLAALLIHRHNLRVDDVARNAIGNCRLHLCDHVRKPRSVLVAVAREQPHAGGAVLALAAVDLRALAVILVLYRATATTTASFACVRTS